MGVYAQVDGGNFFAVLTFLTVEEFLIKVWTLKKFLPSSCAPWGAQEGRNFYNALNAIIVLGQQCAVKAGIWLFILPHKTLLRYYATSPD